MIVVTNIYEWLKSNYWEMLIHKYFMYNISKYGSIIIYLNMHSVIHDEQQELVEIHSNSHLNTWYWSSWKWVDFSLSMFYSLFHFINHPIDFGILLLELDSRASKRITQKSTKSTKAKAQSTETQALVNDVKSSKKKIDTFLQFSFQMDSIVLNLFTSNENLSTLSWIAAHFTYNNFSIFSPLAPTHGLASFGIHFLSLKGCKLVDESMSASIVLCDVQLDDIRPDRQNFITKFVFENIVVIFNMKC